MDRPRDEIDDLIAAGRHLDAARLAASRGDRARAIGLYERIWRFADALPLALELGNRALAVRLSLDAGDPERATQIAATVPAGSVDELRAVADAFAARGRPAEAAELAERTGDFERAAGLYRRAGAALDEARALELGGRLHEAGLAYERLLEEADAALARLRLGRLLARLGRHRDAARHLQVATRAPATRLPARRALTGSLLALGLRQAAEEIVRRLRREVPDTPARPEDVAAAEGPAPAAGSEPLLKGRFRVKRLVGSGAMGRVYLAEDTLLGRPVALKLLAVGAGGAGPERDAFLRFAREANAAGRLRHPNIVVLYDQDEAAGLFVLEYMAGGTLADLLGRRGVLSPTAVRRLGLDLLAALGEAHDQGIVHRDIKPTNIFFDAAGNAKLGDFGAAHLLDFGQTQTGGFVGTVAYMSPEQVSGAPIGRQADFYALGATLFEALTGRRPFLGPDIVAQHLAEPPPQPSLLRPGLAREHDDTLVRCLAKTPADRFGTAAEMAAALRSWPATAALDSPAHAAGEAPADPKVPAAPVASDEVEIGRTTFGRLFLRTDPRVGRSVLIEARPEALSADDRAVLQALAAAGGPYVQRILAIVPDPCLVTYEALTGPLVAVADLTLAQAAAVDEAHDALRAAGIDRALWPTRAIVTAGGPVLAFVHA